MPRYAFSRSARRAMSVGRKRIHASWISKVRAEAAARKKAVSGMSDNQVRQRVRDAIRSIKSNRKTYLSLRNGPYQEIPQVVSKIKGAQVDLVDIIHSPVGKRLYTTAQRERMHKSYYSARQNMP